MIKDYAPMLATKGSVGYDLQSLYAHTLRPGTSTVLETNMNGPLGEGLFGLVCSRSGLAAKAGVFVLNAPGVIDTDYEGTIKIILFNTSTEPYEVGAGDKVAQILVLKRDVLELPEVVDKEDRGDAGLGSTGK